MSCNNWNILKYVSIEDLCYGKKNCALFLNILFHLSVLLWKCSKCVGNVNVFNGRSYRLFVQVFYTRSGEEPTVVTTQHLYIKTLYVILNTVH